MLMENDTTMPSVTRPMMTIKLLVSLCLLAFLVACGPAEPPEPPAHCITHDSPSFDLGTGEADFEPLIEGQDLQMVSGPQGGCHFWLSVHTDGFAERRFDIKYHVLYADSSTTTGSRSSQKVKLNLREDGSGRCFYIGYYAILIEPWKFRDKRVRVDVTVVDDLGLSAETSVEVVARWPEEQEGRSSDDLCGKR